MQRINLNAVLRLAVRTARGALFLLIPVMAACGGGSSGAPPAPPAPGRTTFTGNVARPVSAAAANLIETDGATFPVQVCVAGTSSCTEVDETGAFTLAADVGGDVTLDFDGPGFSARLRLNDVPFGATVRILDIECSTVNGACRAESVEIVQAANAAPLCNSAEASPELLWPPDHRFVPISIIGVFDPDGDPIVVTATNVASNEPDDAPGSGNTAPDAQFNPLAVRAERSGQGAGRVYTIAFTAEDGQGGSCSGFVQVCAPHDQGNRASCF